MHVKNNFLGSKVKVEDVDKSPLLDLPELALECILEKLLPDELCKMTEVCTSLRDRCRSDYLWEKHLNKKWGGVIGDIAFHRWDTFVKNLFRRLPYLCSIMFLYLCLENGKYRFPAQVYNREFQNGRVEFILSCYDAQLHYDSFTHTFQARYPPHGPKRSVTEENVQWDRIRAPPVDNPPHALHTSDCLHDLHPGDHIEIQWRTDRELPYGWWYGVIGHLETCDKTGALCQCHESDTVVVEFNQYSPDSVWSRTTINRNDHQEGGSYEGGFYGGVRKIYSEEQIAMWKSFWPEDIL